MLTPTQLTRLTAAGCILALLIISACNPLTHTETQPEEFDGQGQILIDGSSTVGPITIRVAEAFHEKYPDVEIDVTISGTGGGFKRFCTGETAVSNASRPIKNTEAETCADNNVDYIELPIAFDGIAVLTHPDNDFATCLTTAELATLWRPQAEGTITSWQQLRSDFPDEPIALFGPGTDSGTYDYFTEAVTGEEGESRMDFFDSEDDNELVEGIANDALSTGFFGISYYEENRNKLRLVAIDNGRGCVEPNTETISRSLYEPLSRPLFIYINKQAIQDTPALNHFIQFYLENALNLVTEVGYVPLTDTLYELAQQRYEAQTLGSVFAGEGATVGVSLADLLAKER